MQGTREETCTHCSCPGSGGRTSASQGAAGEAPRPREHDAPPPPPCPLPPPCLSPPPTDLRCCLRQLVVLNHEEARRQREGEEAQGCRVSNVERHVCSQVVPGGVPVHALDQHALHEAAARWGGGIDVKDAQAVRRRTICLRGGSNLGVHDSLPRRCLTHHHLLHMPGMRVAAAVAVAVKGCCRRRRRAVASSVGRCSEGAAGAHVLHTGGGSWCCWCCHRPRFARSQAEILGGRTDGLTSKALV